MSTASRQPALPQPDLSPVMPSPRGSRLRAILPLPAGKPLGILILSIVVLLVPVCLIELPVLRHSHGNVLYPMDGAFLNMTVARNLAFYKVWGVSKYAFQSAATSLFYPLIIAAVFFIAGTHLVIPLIVNVLIAAYFLLLLQRALIRYGLPLLHQLLVLLATMALTLLPLLVVSGMEYVLQLLLVFLFADALIASPRDKKVYIFALLAVATRYEDILVIALACLALGSQKNWKTAAKLAAVALSPIIIFGIISLSKKSYFLPNALLVKPFPTYVLALTILAAAAGAWLTVRYTRISPVDPKQPAPRPNQPAPEAAQPNRRPAQPNRHPAQLAAAILTLLTVPFTLGNAANLSHFQRDCYQVYDGQFLTAGFIHLYYNKSSVGVNQPGAASYFSEGRKLDYTGLASLNVTEKRSQHAWSPRWADSLSRLDGIRIAIVADPWFTPRQLSRWTRIASWNFPDNDPS
ncbi:MAG TPA: hypothetical protein VG605_18740, partial [Puia sp.]|nr:hypothetical protein [Puia sp.]